MRLAVRVGGRCTEILNETMRNLRCQRLQVDEIWTFVQKKQARLTFDERHAPGVGDQYVFVALDADSKLVPHFERNMVTAYKMMDTLRARLAAHFQLMTDGGVPYIGAVDRAWGADAPDFAQLVKLFGASNPGFSRYAPPKMAVSGIGTSRDLGPPPGSSAHLNLLRGATESHDSGWRAGASLGWPTPFPRSWTT